MGDKMIELADTCELKVREDNNGWVFETVPSRNFGLLAVHKEINGRHWTISHIPTGGRVWSGMSHSKAVKVAREMSPWEVWGSSILIEGVSDNTREEWRQLYDRLKSTLRKHGERVS